MVGPSRGLLRDYEPSDGLFSSSIIDGATSDLHGEDEEGAGQHPGHVVTAVHEVRRSLIPEHEMSTPDTINISSS